MHSDESEELVFRAESGGEYFGLIVAHNGRATAITEREALRDVLTPQALRWLLARNPRPEQEVQFRFLRRVDPGSINRGITE